MYLPEKRALTANIIIGLSVALFVYFLKESGLLEFLLAHTVAMLARLHLTLALGRFYYSASALGVAGDVACVVVAASLWTYLRSSTLKLVAVFCLGLVLAPVAMAVYRTYGVILTSPLIALGVALAIAVEVVAVALSRRIDARIADEKREAEFSILGHLTHNVKPNIQMAKSPLLAVRDFLESRALGSEVLAKRMDGSDESVDDALQKALASLDRIGDIMEHTRKLVTDEIRREDFCEFSLADLLLSEVAPHYSGRLRFAVEGDPQITLRLHRASFVEAIHNLVRNALSHAFAGGSASAEVRFAMRETRNRVIIDYINNGRPFPENMGAKDFLACGRKSHDSPGEGLGGAWIGKMVAAHHGSFAVIRDHHPLHFRIEFPKRGI